MENRLSSDINTRNFQNIRHQIDKKKGSNPYHGTLANNKNVTTDYDTFPYPRYFRGNSYVDFPIVAEREAGWRSRNEDCYNSCSVRNENSKKHHNIVKPRHYFQPSCSVVYPKYINENDISLTDVKLNDNCIISYR